MKKRFVFLGCVCLIAWACEDFFEKDLSQKEMRLLVPADSAVVTVGEQTFLWEELEGASAYRLRVVSPDFSCPAVLGGHVSNRLPVPVELTGRRLCLGSKGGKFCLEE